MAHWPGLLTRRAKGLPVKQLLHTATGLMKQASAANRKIIVNKDGM